jgi:hypothetical protein
MNMLVSLHWLWLWPSWWINVCLLFAVNEMISHPFETRSDSFYFVDDRLIMHNKADYAYDGGLQQWSGCIYHHLLPPSLIWGPHGLETTFHVIYCFIPVSTIVVQFVFVQMSSYTKGSVKWNWIAGNPEMLLSQIIHVLGETEILQGLFLSLFSTCMYNQYFRSNTTGHFLRCEEETVITIKLFGVQGVDLVVSFFDIVILW